MTKSVFSDRYETFRLHLIEARKAAGLSQAALADKLSQPQSFVSKYERGERRLDVVEFLDIARAIGINPLKLLGKLDRSKSTHR